MFSITPSAASTINIAPSDNLIAAVASSEKFTWPDVSNIFKRYDLDLTSCSKRVTGVAFVETPLCCSVNNVSVYLIAYINKNYIFF